MNSIAPVAPVKDLKTWIQEAKRDILAPMRVIQANYVDKADCPPVVRDVMRGLINSTFTADEARRLFTDLEKGLSA